MATKPEHEHGTPSNLPRGAWRTEVDLRVRELRSRLKAAEAGEGTQGVEHQNASAAASGSENAPATAQRLQTSTRGALVTVDVHEVATEPPPPLPQKVHEARIAAIEEAIEHATEAIRDASITQRLAEWWTGSAITAGWESVHTAEAELVDVESEADVRASLPHLVAWLSQVMPTGEPRKRYEGELGSYIEASKPLDRTTVRLIYKDVVKANNESKANLRAFRNLLTVLTGVLALLLVVVAIWHAINPEFVSLCSTSGSGASSATTCISGSSPRGQDVLAVELLGAIGGLLSLAVAFSGSTETPPSRYNVRPQQAALKVVAGGATGLIGVLIVQSGIIVSPATQTSSEALFLVYAAVFGFSQQLFTKFVDKRAESLLGESEEKKETKGSSSSTATKA
ncbi:MAG: hypothetical protein WAU69_09135 [Solirubrobacteraceae bacterium]